MVLENWQKNYKKRENIYFEGLEKILKDKILVEKKGENSWEFTARNETDEIKRRKEFKHKTSGILYAIGYMFRH